MRSWEEDREQYAIRSTMPRQEAPAPVQPPYCCAPWHGYSGSGIPQTVKIAKQSLKCFDHIPSTRISDPSNEFAENDEALIKRFQVSQCDRKRREFESRTVFQNSCKLVLTSKSDHAKPCVRIELNWINSLRYVGVYSSRAAGDRKAFPFAKWRTCSFEVSNGVRARRNPCYPCTCYSSDRRLGTLLEGWGLSEPYEKSRSVGWTRNGRPADGRRCIDQA